MTIDEAIKYLKPLTNTDLYDLDPEEMDAVKLGIEALRWVKRYRPNNKTDKWALLLGEKPE